MANGKIERPTHVFIGYATYEIRWMDETEWADEKNDNDWAGVTEHEQHLIGVRLMSRTESSLQETLIHEITHAAWAVVGINHAHPHFPEDVREEMIVTQQSPMLLFVLKHNPHVLAYLTAEPEDVKV